MGFKIENYEREIKTIMNKQEKKYSFDLSGKLIELDFRDIRKIYLPKDKNYCEIWYYNGEKIHTTIDEYYNIQEFMIDNNLDNFMNRFELPIEFEDKFESDTTLLDDYKILNNLVKTYEDKQLIVAVEELSELQKELCKSLRDKTNIDNLIEELADVEIMLQQIKIYFDIPSLDIEIMKKRKINRTKERYL